MSIFGFEKLFDFNGDDNLDLLERGAEFTVINDIINDSSSDISEDDDFLSSDFDDEDTESFESLLDDDFGSDF